VRTAGIRLPHLVRWYDAYDDAAFAAPPLEQSLCRAVYYFFLEEYDIACAGLRTPLICAAMPTPAYASW